MVDDIYLVVPLARLMIQELWDTVLRMEHAETLDSADDARLRRFFAAV